METLLILQQGSNSSGIYDIPSHHRWSYSTIPEISPTEWALDAIKQLLVTNRKCVTIVLLLQDAHNVVAVMVVGLGFP